MKQFKIIPLSETYAAKIRETKTDDYGHHVTEQVANGKGPCRVSLKPFKVGKDVRLLLSHSPFEIDNAYNTKLVAGNEDVDLLIPEIFSKHPEIEYLHARSANACCFICKMERASKMIRK